MHRITELVCMIKVFTNSFTNILSSIWSVYVSTVCRLVRLDGYYHWHSLPQEDGSSWPTFEVCQLFQPCLMLTLKYLSDVEIRSVLYQPGTWCCNMEFIQHLEILCVYKTGLTDDYPFLKSCKMWTCPPVKMSSYSNKTGVTNLILTAAKAIKNEKELVSN